MANWVKRNLEHQEIHGYGLFSVILKRTGNLIGNCGLEHMELNGEEVVELGYDFVSHYWNQGYATEAARGCIRYARHELGNNKIHTLIRPENEPSLGVAAKLGMRIEKSVQYAGFEHYMLSRSPREEGP